MLLQIIVTVCSKIIKRRYGKFQFYVIYQKVHTHCGDIEPINDVTIHKHCPKLSRNRKYLLNNEKVNELTIV